VEQATARWSWYSEVLKQMSALTESYKNLLVSIDSKNKGSWD
jgi:hypothetical protein